jgi:hypothetical protein
MRSTGSALLRGALGNQEAHKATTSAPEGELMTHHELQVLYIRDMVLLLLSLFVGGGALIGIIRQVL